MNKPKIHTMKELSKAIAVSRPTLARYFEDEKSVLPSTAKKIRAGLAQVDYVYNFLATRQNRKLTGLIGVVIPYFEDLFYASLLSSIEVAVRAAGFTMITQSSQGDTASEMSAIRKLRSMNVDGAIVAPLAGSANGATLDAASRDFPIIFVDSYPVGQHGPVDFVGTDNVNSISIMIDYLCRTGLSPAYLAMPKLNSNALERLNVYTAQMKERGFEADVIAIPRDTDSWQFECYGFDVMDAHFSHGRYVGATVLCANDRIAIGAIRAANKHGLFSRNGEARGDLRIAGHDDHPLSRYMSPAVTTVAQEVDGIGRDAVDLLVKRLEQGREGSAFKVLKEGTLKIRESA